MNGRDTSRSLPRTRSSGTKRAMGGVLVLAACFVPSTVHAESGPPEPSAPPRVLLTSSEGKLVTKRGSYCSWDGCVDRSRPTTRQALLVNRKRRAVMIHTRASASEVRVYTSAGHPFARVRSSFSLAGITGRLWRMRVPNRAPRTSALVIVVEYQAAEFPLQDGSFGGRIRLK